MRETLFTGKIPISCINEDIPWQMKCDMVRTPDTLEIRLIDTRDIFTFYVSTISPSDFYVMKREQGIIVDYEKFITILTKMLHAISSNRLVAMFSKETTKFHIIEKDEFKDIVKLELKFIKPSETHYKMYLGDIISRLETDNIKLIKENGMLRDQCRSGDRELTDKIRYMEEECSSVKRKLELLYKENDELNSKYDQKVCEIEALNTRILNLEKENAKLQFDLDKAKIQEVKSAAMVDKARDLERSNKKLQDELRTANDIIRKLSEESESLKKAKASFDDSTRELKAENKKLKGDLEDTKKRAKSFEEKYRKVRDEGKSRDGKMKEYEAEISSLKKKLENAQNVYNHFYSKNVEDRSPPGFSEASSGFSIHPESPPH